MKSKKKYLLIIITVLLIVTIIILVKYISPHNPLKVDISKIDLIIEVERFDLDIQDVKNGNSYEKVQNISKKYNEFFDIYNNQVIGIGSTDNSSYLAYLITFLNDYSVVEATKEIATVYKDIDKINEDLTYCFKHFKYYYPDSQFPRFISFVAGFNQSIINTDDFIGIGLDKYLGANCELYKMLNIPEYLRFEMSPDQIVIDITTVLAKEKYPFEPEVQNLLSAMIYNGKILYFIDAMLPEFKESRKNKYTEQQIGYCYHFEKNMWTSLIENKLLFSTDYFTIRKFTENSPYTYQFGPDSPPRTANWLGLQIVRSYMKNNKNISLKELMEDSNYQKILNLSQYSPS